MYICTYIIGQAQSNCLIYYIYYNKIFSSSEQARGLFVGPDSNRLIATILQELFLFSPTGPWPLAPKQKRSCKVEDKIIGPGLACPKMKVLLFSKPTLVLYQQYYSRLLLPKSFRLADFSGKRLPWKNYQLCIIVQQAKRLLLEGELSYNITVRRGIAWRGELRRGSSTPFFFLFSSGLL